MVRLFGFAFGGRAAANGGNGDRAAVDEVDRASGSRSNVKTNSLSEKSLQGKIMFEST